jgi:polysaccharide pyruvyl transferase WcaK-like protein
MHQKRSNTTKLAENLSQYRFIGGTNALGFYPFKRAHFHHKIYDYIKPLRYILLGVGWRSDIKSFSFGDKILYRKFLENKKPHSVRDSFTLNKLKNIGINNVINTSCPTTWTLTEKIIDKIPKVKSSNVVFTLTDYSKNYKADSFLLEALFNNYSKIIFWPQGSRDLVYLKELLTTKKYLYDKLTIIPGTILAFNQLLNNRNIEYVGTRLHAAIKALNHSKKISLISIDNRSRELCKDIGIEVLERNEIINVNNFINRTNKMELAIPFEAINEWRSHYSIR